ncbi:MAG: squalene/phytoene synthase family protein [candidate division Zixibacteria bacterium]|nr:squalene/phytoene synthase family protein [candidate division Zixibacteria bacterium]
MAHDSDTTLDFASDLDFSEILTNPILDIAARFWEQDRYEAFRVCYRSMRRIDDLVDDRKAAGVALTAQEIRQYEAMIERWMNAVRAGRAEDAFQKEFVNTLDCFALPFWPWERLFRAMAYDLTHNGFPTFLTFLRYCEGAAISPAAIFMHLCGVRRAGEKYQAPEFDIRKVARPLAVFSYLVHIMRDFQKDQEQGLNYFADDLCARCGLSSGDLRAVAGSGQPTPDFRRLMALYQGIAEYYRRKSRAMIDRMKAHLEPRYYLSYEIIYSLYLQIFERVNPEEGTLSTAAMNPSPEEVRARIDTTVRHIQSQSNV